jgi:hypothetical protein
MTGFFGGKLFIKSFSSPPFKNFHRGYHMENLQDKILGWTFEKIHPIENLIKFCRKPRKDEIKK